MASSSDGNDTSTFLTRKHTPKLAMKVSPLISYYSFIAILVSRATAWSLVVAPRSRTLCHGRSSSLYGSSTGGGYDEQANLDARAMLYEDMQRARAVAAEVEGDLLAARVTDLLAPIETTLEGAASAPLPKKHKKIVKRGTGSAGGFGTAATASGGKTEKTAMKKKRKRISRNPNKMTPKEKQTLHQAATLRADGCLRIEGALQKSTAARVKACVLREIENAASAVAADPANIEAIHAEHGIDQERINRCVINLPLRADVIDGYGEACHDADPDFQEGDSSDPITDALTELLDHEEGALGQLIAELCGYEAPLYELCSLVTWPGSLRQSVHPDAAYQPNAPLYAAFVACQDITVDIGPTVFLPGTHLPTPQRAKFDNIETRNAMIAEFPEPKLATLKQGDLAIFDMRCLHVGSANHPERGSSRVLFNLTFRNPEADEEIGYDGSIRNHYFEKFNLAGMQDELQRGKVNANAFVDVA